MKNLHTFDEFLTEKKKSEEIKKGDIVLYSYNRSGQHPLGGSHVIIALNVKDIIVRSGGRKFAEVFLDGRFQDISFEYLIPTNSDFKDGEIIKSKSHFSKEDLEKLKYKL